MNEDGYFTKTRVNQCACMTCVFRQDISCSFKEISIDKDVKCTNYVSKEANEENTIDVTSLDSKGNYKEFTNKNE